MPGSIPETASPYRPPQPSFGLGPALVVSQCRPLIIVPWGPGFQLLKRSRSLRHTNVTGESRIQSDSRPHAIPPRPHPDLRTATGTHTPTNPIPSFQPQRESRALIRRQDGYVNQHAPGGRVDLPPGPFLQTRIRLNGRKGSGSRCDGNGGGGAAGMTEDYRKALVAVSGLLDF